MEYHGIQNQHYCSNMAVVFENGPQILVFSQPVLFRQIGCHPGQLVTHPLLRHTKRVSTGFGAMAMVFGLRSTSSVSRHRKRAEMKTPMNSPVATMLLQTPLLNQNVRWRGLLQYPIGQWVEWISVRLGEKAT